jgi:endonuclease/exonuclease/phosphatase family metal-dependent hydrolase
MLTVLTINLWGTNGPVTRRMKDLGAYLKRTRPDVVAMQEVDETRRSTQSHELARAAGYETVHHARTGRIRGEGLAILTNHDTKDAALVPLPSSKTDHRRGLQLVDIVVSDGQTVRVGNTHLAWRLGATALRTLQAERIREEFRTWAGPAILFGDLNDVPGSPPLRILTEPEMGYGPLVDSYPPVYGDEGWTFHPDNPFVRQPKLARRRIDYVLVRGLDILDVAVVLTGQDAPIVSDHFGVQASVALP